MGEAKRSAQIAGCLEECSVVIPGLPNHLALLIMVRLPRALHGSLRRVCSAWRDALQPSSVTALRNSLHISEIWVSLLFDNLITFYDPLLQRLSSPIPLCADTDPIEVLTATGSQAFTVTYLRGCGTIQCFDAASMQSQFFPVLWNEQVLAADYTGAAIDGHIYVVGGSDFSSGGLPNAYKSAARLDVKTKTWEAMPEMHEGRVRAQAVVLQGCLYVIGGYSYVNCHQSGEIWDPRSQEWVLEPQLWPMEVSGHNFRTRVAVVLGILYALKVENINDDEERDDDWELMRYVSDSKMWISLGSFSIKEYACMCGRWKVSQLVGVGEELWVIIKCFHEFTAHIVSCVPSTVPPQWRSVAISSSVEFPMDNVVVAGIVHV